MALALYRLRYSVARPTIRGRSGVIRLGPVVAVLSLLLLVAATPSAAQPADPGPPPIGDVLKEMPRDLWHFVSWDTAIVLGVGAGAAGIGHIWDDNLSGELETNVRLNDAMEPGHTYGAFSFQVLIGTGMYATGWFARKGKLAEAGADIMRAQLVSQAYVQAIKYTAQRERPDGSNNLSFPSGHSASAFATAGVLQRHYGWKLGVPATVVAAYVATARVHDNKHYLSDVIFGGAMGIAGERTITRRAGRYGLDVVPIVGGGRAGVLVSLQGR